MRRISLVYVLASVAFAGILFLYSTGPVKAAPAESMSYIRVIHASPYVGTADVFVDGKLLLSSFQFASVTPYVPVPAGTHTVQISVVGKGIGASVLDQDLTVSAGGVYTIAALGTKANALSLRVFSDDNSVVPDRAKVRIYHLAPDAGLASLNIGGDFNFNNVSYIQASPYVTEDTGPCPMTFADPQYSKTLERTADLQSNTITSVFAVGLFQGSPNIQLVLTQTPGIPGPPNTGSDPTPVQNSVVQPWFLWIFASAMFLFCSTMILLYLYKMIAPRRG